METCQIPNVDFQIPNEGPSGNARPSDVVTFHEPGPGKSTGGNRENRDNCLCYLRLLLFKADGFMLPMRVQFLEVQAFHEPGFVNRPLLLALRSRRDEGGAVMLTLVPQSVLMEYKRLCCGQECPAYD